MHIDSGWVMFLDSFMHVIQTEMLPIKSFIVLALLHEDFSQNEQEAEIRTETDPLLIRSKKKTHFFVQHCSFFVDTRHWQTHMRNVTEAETAVWFD